VRGRGERGEEGRAKTQGAAWLHLGCPCLMRLHCLLLAGYLHTYLGTWVHTYVPTRLPPLHINPHPPCPTALNPFLLLWLLY
jgi:hypothetical protein